METRNYTVYKFNELPEESKKKVLNNYRYFNVDHDSWYEYILTEFEERLNAIGYTTKYNDIHFSGFCSQGDGACFDGKGFVDLVNHAINLEPKFRPLQHLVNEGSFTVTIEKNSFGNHYSHERTRNISVECDSKTTEEEDIIIYDLQLWLEDERIELCRELYKRLSEAYDYLTSDEAIEESLISNDYDFTIEGKID